MSLTDDASRIGSGFYLPNVNEERYDQSESSKLLHWALFNVDNMIFKCSIDLNIILITN